MTEKNLEKEKVNDLNHKQMMSNEEMKQFINDNISVIPRYWCKKFESLKTIEEKVSKIQYYIDYQKRKKEYVEKNRLENRVDELFKRRKVSIEDVVRVIDFCKKYIESTKEEEINKLQNEIDRLTQLKNTLKSN